MLCFKNLNELILSLFDKIEIFNLYQIIVSNIVEYKKILWKLKKNKLKKQKK